MNKIEELEKQAKEILEEIEKLKSEESKEESKVWKPKKNEIYFNIFSWGDIDSSLWNGCEADEERYEMGNCFKTREEAKKAAEKHKIYTQLKRLAEENNREPIDWDKKYQNKYYICYNIEEKEFCDDEASYIKRQGVIYCTNPGFLNIALERIGEENLLKLFKE